MDHRISSDQYVGRLKSAIEASADKKEGFIRDALLYLTSAGSLHPKAIAALKTSLTKQKAFRIEIEWRRYGSEYAESAAQQGAVPAEESPSGPMHNGSRIAEFARGNAATERREPERVAKDNVVRYIPSYRVTVNDRLDEGERFATIAHELGHIFCGHLGGCNSARMDDKGGWPDRASLGKHEQEIEAEALRMSCARVEGLFQHRHNT